MIFLALTYTARYRHWKIGRKWRWNHYNTRA